LCADTTVVPIVPAVSAKQFEADPSYGGQNVQAVERIQGFNVRGALAFTGNPAFPSLRRTSLQLFLLSSAYGVL